ncbi:MAG: ABC transporter permease [Chloroflexota bacterium]
MRRRGRSPLLSGPPLVGLVLTTLIAVLVVAAPLLAPAEPIQVNILKKFRPPGSEFLLGSDFFGRDLLSRFLWGGQTTLLVGLGVIAAACLAGIPVGLLAGHARGWVDSVAMRLADAMLAFPSLVLAIAIASALGPSLTNAMLAVAIAYTPQFARMARGQALVVAALPFVEAAQAAGASGARILAWHVAPNCIGPLAVQASLNLGSAILATASLGFLGLGAQAPYPEWGADVAASTVYVRETPWPALWPGLGIVVSALAVNLLADGLVDWLNPRLRDR